MSYQGPSLTDETMQPTRQQLDDLETLIQQMLALPVTRAPGETEPTSPQTESLEPTSSQPLHMERLVDRAGDVHPLLLSHFRETVEPAAESTPDVWRELSASATALAESAPTSSVDESIETRPVAVGVVVRPLVWIDRAFVAGTRPLGGTGRWLQGGVGRTVVGLAGLALLGTAIAWGILDWIGWSP